MPLYLQFSNWVLELSHKYDMFLLFNIIVFNATFTNIPVTSWWSVLLVEEITDMPQVTDKLYQIMLNRLHLAWAVCELITVVVIGTDCKGSYATTMTRTAPPYYWCYCTETLVCFPIMFPITHWSAHSLRASG